MVNRDKKSSKIKGIDKKSVLSLAFFNLLFNIPVKPDNRSSDKKYKVRIKM